MMAKLTREQYNKWNAQAKNGFYIRLARIHLHLGSAVYSNRRNALFLGCNGKIKIVFVIIIPAKAHFYGHRDIYSVFHRFDDYPCKTSVSAQSGA